MSSRWAKSQRLQENLCIVCSFIPPPPLPPTESAIWASQSRRLHPSSLRSSSGVWRPSLLACCSLWWLSSTSAGQPLWSVKGLHSTCTRAFMLSWCHSRESKPLCLESATLANQYHCEWCHHTDKPNSETQRCKGWLLSQLCRVLVVGSLNPVCRLFTVAVVEERTLTTFCVGMLLLLLIGVLHKLCMSSMFLWMRFVPCLCGWDLLSQ